MKQKRYMDIERMKEKYEGAFRRGDEIIVEEKIDGASAAFAYDPAQDKILAFSRKTELNEANNLRGFWDWTQHLDKKGIAHMTQNGRYVIFGEWLVKHTVCYPEHEYNHFWMFDVWDTQDEKWLHYDDVRAIHAGLLNVAQLTQEVINFVPVFYDGPFISWDHLYQMVRRTDVGAEPCGEGIVIKNQNTIDIPEWRLPTYVKIVSEKFSEVHDSKPKKPVDPAVLAAREAERQMVATVVTERRIAKLIEKMVDTGIIPEDWDEKSMSVIAKNIGKLAYEDCVKEEPEIVAACENFGKNCNSIAMGYVKEMLKSR